MFRRAVFFAAMVVLAIVGFIGCADAIQVRLDQEVYNIEYGGKLQYQVLNIPEGTKFEVSVSDLDILDVTENELSAIKVGTTVLTVSMNGVTLHATVVVHPKKLDTPEVSISGDILSWNEVEHADTYILSIGSKVVEQVETEYDISALESGKYTINICATTTDTNYDKSNYSTAVINVRDAFIAGIRIDRQPKTVYKDGEVFNPVGIKVEAIYNNGYIEDVTSFVTYDKTILGIGDNTVTVSYEGFSASLPVTVNPVINFVTNGGESIGEISREEGTALDILPSRSGYTFLGWYTDEAFTKEFEGNVPHSSITLYARWVKGDAIVVNAGQSIQDAVDNAPSGGTVFVKAGSYAEYITIDKPLTLLGNNFDVEATKTRKPETIIYPASNLDFNHADGAALVTIYSFDVKVAGFAINGDNPDLENIWTAEQNALMQALAAGDSKSRVEVRALYNSLVGKEIGIDAAIGVRAIRKNTTDPSLSNVVIENNIVSNFALAGIVMENNNHAKAAISTEGTMITGNHISRVRGFGLLYGNAYYGVYGHAIIADAVTLTVKNNTVVDCVMGIQYTWVYITGFETKIVDNKFINNSVGIWINTTGFSTAMTIAGNTIERNQDFSDELGKHAHSLYGILLSSTENGKLTIKNNIVENYDVGMLFANVRDNTVLVEGNTVKACNTAMAVRKEFLTFTSSAACYVTIRNDNILSGNDTNYAMDDTTANCTKFTFVNEYDEVIDVMAKGVLSKPVISLSGTNVRWKEVANAIDYKIFLNDAELDFDYGEAVNGYFYIPLDMVGEALESYNFQVVAIGIGGVADSYSDMLSLVRVTVKETMFNATITTAEKTNYYLSGVKLPLDVATKTRSSFALQGWYIDPDCQMLADMDTAITASVTLYGVWLRTSAYTYYDGSTVIATGTLKYGETVPTIDNPVKEGYTFVGWYTSNKYTQEFDFETTSTGAAIKIYAKFVKN